MSCPGQYLGDVFGNDMAFGMASTGGDLDMPRASPMNLGDDDATDVPGPRRDHDSGIGMPSFSTQGRYPPVDGRYGIGQGLGYGCEVRPSYGYVGGMAPGYAGGMDSGFVYGSGMGTAGTSAMGTDGSYTTIGSKYPPRLGYGGPLGVGNPCPRGAGMTSYPIGGLSYAPVYPFMNAESTVPFPQQRAPLSANENTNTNVNINSSMEKHRARLIGRGLIGTAQF